MKKENSGNLQKQDHMTQNEYKMNSKEYWDFRFKTSDWQNNFGDQQTLHFYTLLVNGIPENLQEEMNSKGYSVVDFGCAQGEGTNFFAKMFPNIKTTGVDFSCEAIKIAEAKHTNASYKCEDLLNSPLSNKVDVIISSNTLEHFYHPWEVLEKLTKQADKYVIILVPFDQQNIPYEEHFYSFNYDNIPSKVNNFTLTFKKILYPDPKFWAEKQILLIYTRNN